LTISLFLIFSFSFVLQNFHMMGVVAYVDKALFLIFSFHLSCRTFI
jgi:hypothetical protein